MKEEEEEEEEGRTLLRAKASFATVKKDVILFLLDRTIFKKIIRFYKGKVSASTTLISFAESTIQICFDSVFIWYRRC
jgi:hypothetical protein